MDEMELLVDLHADGDRQGPGGDAATRRAIDLSGLGARRDLRVADIGCGTGASTLVLARELDAVVVGVDLFPAFLRGLSRRAATEGLAGRIAALAGSMEDLPFASGSLDTIWSEGAIYNMGFAAGVDAWRPLLRPGGLLVVSELTWLTRERPAEIQRHWDEEYPEVATAAEKFAVLEGAGYSPLGYFPLPVNCWLDNYYRPVQDRLPAFVARHADSDEARAIAAAEQAEISLYERHADVVSYGVYVARRTDG